MIRVYNTLSKSKEPFETVQPGKVGVYLCGPTVYKPSHIGHMVGPVIFDAIKRYLTYCGYQVTWVVNVTDVDDKLIVESGKRKMDMAALAAEMTEDYMRNLAAMGVDTIDHFPRATEHIGNIIEFTADLVHKGYAYESDGDVYFDVGKAKDYGKLSHRTIEAMQGEGGEAAERKRSTADFALWKSAKSGEPSWPSPWGHGRPGWHIECSVMSQKLLGDTFDIHGGGLDLVFPHHENEIAQSESRTGKAMARYWLHNGLMQASDEVGKVGGRQTRPAAGDREAQEVGKISKSKGAAPFRDLLAEFSPETIRFFLLSTHYRRPIEFGEGRLHEIETALETFYRFFARYQRVTGKDIYQAPYPARRADGQFDPAGSPLLADVAQRRDRFLEAMDDDFNTGGAIGDLFELVRRLNKYVEDEKLEDTANRRPEKVAALAQGATTLRELAGTLGLFRQPPQEQAAGDDELVGKLMDLLIQVRADSRKAKNFAMADRIRNTLAEIGVVLEDHPSGTQWSREEVAGRMSTSGDRILGVDPGLNVTGYGVLEAAGGKLRLCEAGVVRGRSRGSLTARVLEIHQGIREVIAALGPTAMALEELYSHYKRPRVAILMGHARGVICLAGAEAGIPVLSYPSTQVKRILTGNGRASKSQVQTAIQRELGLQSVPEPADVADALAVALCHYYLKDRPAAMRR